MKRFFILLFVLSVFSFSMHLASADFTVDAKVAEDPDVTDGFVTTLTFSNPVTGGSHTNSWGSSWENIVGDGSFIRTSIEWNAEKTVYTEKFTVDGDRAGIKTFDSGFATDADDNESPEIRLSVNFLDGAENVGAPYVTRFYFHNSSQINRRTKEVFPIWVSFSEPVEDFTYSDITVTGDSEVVTLTTSRPAKNGGKTYGFTLTPTGSGTVIFELGAGVATDSDDYKNTAHSQKLTLYSDFDAPTVTITPDTSDLQDSVFNVTVKFSEPVSFSYSHLVSRIPISFTGGTSRFLSRESDETIPGGSSRPAAQGLHHTFNYSVSVPSTSSSVTVSIPKDSMRDWVRNYAEATEFTFNIASKYDIDKDGDVDIDDIRLVVEALGNLSSNLRADVDGDRDVDKDDILLVIDNVDDDTEAPAISELLSNSSQEFLKALDPDALRSTLDALILESDGSLKYQRTIALLQSMLDAMRPEKTILLANYPNPFNPETWIPYELAKESSIVVTIYDVRGRVVRRLDLGHLPPGYYTSRNRAAYWDGRNAVGESVASGIYFYQLRTDNMSLLRKMLILK